MTATSVRKLDSAVEVRSLLIYIMQWYDMQLIPGPKYNHLNCDNTLFFNQTLSEDFFMSTCYMDLNRVRHAKYVVEKIT